MNSLTQMKKTPRIKEGSNSGGSNFYFYSSTTVAFGKQEFKKRWGNRKLEDNWRLSDKISKLENFEEEIAYTNSRK